MTQFKVYYRNKAGAGFCHDVEAQTPEQAIEVRKQELKRQGYKVEDFTDFTCDNKTFY